MYSSAGLPGPGSVLQLRVVSVQAGGEQSVVRLWGSVGERAEEHQRLRAVIRAEVAGYPAVPAEQVSAVGQCYLVEESGEWLRGKVLCRLGTEYKVYLLDRGSITLTHPHKLRIAPSTVFQLPPQVLGCVLSNLVPLEQKGWSIQALNQLHSLPGQEVEGVVKDLILPQGIVILDLPALSKRLLALFLAKSLPDPLFRILVDRSLAQAGGSDHWPETTEATPANVLNVTSQRVPWQGAGMDYFYPQIQTGVTEPVVVTQVTDPQRIFCQLRSLSHEVQRLADSMHHFYQSQNSCGEPNYQRPLALGQPCASRGTDGRWYRSLLQEIFPDKQLAVVIHVDWGRRDVVPLASLRNLAADFFRMPVVTFRCALYGVSDEGTGWSPQLIFDLRSFLHERHVIAKIEFFNSYEHLYVITLFAENGLNVNCFYGMQAQSLKVCQTKTPVATEMTPCAKEDIVKNENSKVPQESFYSPEFPIMELKIGAFYDAMVAFAIDPSDFWIHTEDCSAKNKEMTGHITTLYSRGSKLEGIITKPVPGQLCCAKFKDDLYYRAEIVSVDKKQVKLYFLDHGNSEIVDFYNVKELPAEFRDLPALANRCCLADISPLEETWSDEAILAFKVAVVDKKLVIYVVSKEPDKYTVEVLDQSRIEERSVGKILCNAGYVHYEELEPVIHFSDVDTIVVELGQTKLSPATLNQVSSKTIYQETTDSCPGEDYPDELHYSPFEEQLFEPGATIEVAVSHVDNPGLFWCQNSAHRLELSALMNVIQKHCSCEICPYESGAFACLAQCPSSGLWYRAFIIEVPSSMSKADSVQVLFVDFGNKKTVPVSNLRAMKSDFFHLKAQAFKCSVYDIITPTGKNPFNWDNGATKVFCDFVSEALNWSEFHCTVFAIASLDKTLFNIVDLSTPFSSVCDTLVKRGYATRQLHKTPAPSVELHSFYYSMHGIKTGSEEEVYITHVNPSLEFYCQLSRSAEIIENISDAIANVCNKTQHLKLSHGSGPLCLAKFSDQQWYRGFIRSDMKTTAEIFFVDFGNVEIVAKEDLLPILCSESELLLSPMQAIKCSLPDIPSNVSSEIVSWFEKAVLSKALRALVVAKETDGKLLLELYDGTEQINATIKSKLGFRVPKTALNCLSNTPPHISKQNEARKPIINIDTREKKSFKQIFVNKESDTVNSDIGPVLRNKDTSYKKNQVAAEHVTENRDYIARFQESNSQKKKSMTFQSAPPSRPYLERKVGRDTTPNVSKSERPSTFAEIPSSAAKPPLAKFSEIPRRQIIPGMKLPVYISHTNTVFDFYVQFAEDSQLDEVSEMLNGDKSRLEVLPEKDIRVGDVVCAYFADDELYYRAVVTGKSTKNLNVEYIDYGNSSVLSDCKTYRLAYKLCSVPVMSIHCSLSRPDCADSSPSMEELLHEFTKRTSDIQLDCQFVKPYDIMWEVILNDKNGCINDLLSSSGAHLLEEPFEEEVGEMAIEQKAVKEDASTKSFTWNFPQPGETVQVYASAVDSPEYFWCQLSTADIDSLATQVQEAGEQSIKNEEFIAAIELGSPCNVLYSEDDNWYRAIVTKMEADLVTVRFIDYGNEDIVNVDSIRQLSDTLLKIPAQSFPCCLGDFNFQAGNWTSEGRNYFYENVSEDLLEVAVHNIQENLLLVPLAFVRIKSNEVNINEEMRRYWEIGQNIVSELPTESSYIELIEEALEETQVHLEGSRESPTSKKGQRHCLHEDLQCDTVCPFPEDDAESCKDGVKETSDLLVALHLDAATAGLELVDEKDCVLQDDVDFDSNGMKKELSSSIPVQAAGEPDVMMELDDAEIPARQQSASSRQQEILTRDNSESLESLILQFSEKLVLINEEAISEDTSKQEITTEHSALATIEKMVIPAVETSEEFIVNLPNYSLQVRKEGDTDVSREEFVEKLDFKATEGALDSEEAITGEGILKSEEAVASEDAQESEEAVASEDAQESEEAVASEDAQESEEAGASDDALDSEEAVTGEGVLESEGTVASDDALDSEEAVTGEGVLKSEEAVASEDAQESEEAVASEDAQESEEAVASDDALDSEEAITSEGVLESEEAVASESAQESEVAVTGEGTLVIKDAVASEDALDNKEAVTGEGVLESEEAVAFEGVLQSEEAVACEDALDSEGAVASEGALESEGAVASEGALESEEAVASEDALESEGALACEGALESEGAVACEGALDSEGPVASEGALDSEGPVASEGALDSEEPVASEGALDSEEPVASEGALDSEEPVASEGALDSEEAVASEGALDSEGAVASEDALDSEGAVASEDALDSEGAVASEGALDSEGAVASEGALESEEAVTSEDALESEEAVASEDALKSEGAVACEGALDSEGPVASEGALDSEEPVASEGALDSEEPVASEGALDSEEPVASEGALDSEEPVASEGALDSEEAVAFESVQESEGDVVSEDVQESEGAVASEDVQESEGAVAAGGALDSEGAVAAGGALDSEGAVAAESALDSEGAVAAEGALDSEGAVAFQDALDSEKVVAWEDVVDLQALVGKEVNFEMEESVASVGITGHEKVVADEDILESEEPVPSRGIKKSKHDLAGGDSGETEKIVVCKNIVELEETVARDDFGICSQATAREIIAESEDFIADKVEESLEHFQIEETFVNVDNLKFEDTLVILNVTQSKGAIASKDYLEIEDVIKCKESVANEGVRESKEAVADESKEAVDIEDLKTEEAIACNSVEVLTAVAKKDIGEYEETISNKVILENVKTETSKDVVKSEIVTNKSETVKKHLILTNVTVCKLQTSKQEYAVPEDLVQDVCRIPVRETATDTVTPESYDITPEDDSTGACEQICALQDEDMRELAHASSSTPEFSEPPVNRSDEENGTGVHHLEIADVGCLENQARRLDNFLVYRACPVLIASTDSVYDSDVGEPAVEADSVESEVPLDSTEELGRSDFYQPETAETEDLPESADNTLTDDTYEADDYSPEYAVLGETGNRVPDVVHVDIDQDFPGEMEKSPDP
ncbi:tudor domain-containing protein 6 isoform X2 [Mixophyes fleayi]|uniref:tudor domain-containing protein 6 isoform X2 n=1 Tax=Mixophyes fleayi TaxID=3061075 RepID=UPI003F4DB55B